LSKKQIKSETNYTLRGYGSLEELQSLVAATPKEFFEHELLIQLLKKRVQRGEKSAATEHLLLLRHRILHGSVSAMDMLEIAEILENLVNQDLAFQALRVKKRGRSKRNAKLCLEISSRVLNVSQEQNVPIRDATGDGTPDAIAIVAAERERARAKPWSYDTVKHYYDEGKQLSTEVADATINSMTHAVNFISELEEETQESESVPSKSRPRK